MFKLKAKNTLETRTYHSAYCGSGPVGLCWTRWLQNKNN